LYQKIRNYHVSGNGIINYGQIIYRSRARAKNVFSF
jgi:hypothetical protein